jgi:hypothetical protein
VANSRNSFETSIQGRQAQTAFRTYMKNAFNTPAPDTTQPGPSSSSREVMKVEPGLLSSTREVIDVDAESLGPSSPARDVIDVDAMSSDDEFLLQPFFSDEDLKQILPERVPSPPPQVLRVTRPLSPPLAFDAPSSSKTPAPAVLALACEDPSTPPRSLPAPPPEALPASQSPPAPTPEDPAPPAEVHPRKRKCPTAPTGHAK